MLKVITVFADHASEFYRRHPALLLGLFTLLAVACKVAWHPVYLFALLCLALPCALHAKLRRLLFLAILLGIGAFGWASFRLPHVKLGAEKIEGEGIFHIDTLSIAYSPFNRSYHYKGVLKRFTTREGVTYCDLPCSVFHGLKGPPRADRDYVIEGALVQKKPYMFSLKHKKGKKWKSVDGTFSFAEWRFRAKQRVSHYIKENISDAMSGSFLSALVTGDVDERSLRLDFGRLGLQHVLAISGFHFSFFALALNCVLRPFLPFAIRIPLLIGSLAAYMAFLGNAPSILRAFTAISIILSGQMIRRRSTGLNALGAALIIELLLDPYALTALSFQLSFLCTLALLLFNPVMHHLCCYLLPERTFEELQSMSLLDRHGYVLSALLRKILSLNLAVHLFSLPVLLHLFHKFPLLSLFYNLFFPLCVSLSLVLLFCALLCAPLLEPLSRLFHSLNDMWTSTVLQLSSNPPAYFDFVIRSKSISFVAVVISLTLLFYVGILFYSHQRKKLIKI